MTGFTVSASYTCIQQSSILLNRTSDSLNQIKRPNWLDVYDKPTYPSKFEICKNSQLAIKQYPTTRTNVWL